MTALLLLISWSILFLLSWPVALLALVKSILFLPARLLGYRS